MKMALVTRKYIKPGTDDVQEALGEMKLQSSKLVHQVRKLEGDAMPSKVVFLVPSDHDYGGTAGVLMEFFDDLRDVEVFEAAGHHSSGALNAVTQHLHDEGFTHVVFLSGKAWPYISDHVMQRVAQRFVDGDAATAVFVKELNGNQPVPFQNTFAGYDISALQEVGGFTSDTGVEEMSVLAELVRNGCGVSVLPADGEAKLEIRQHGGAPERHAEVRDTKIDRQLSELARVGSSVEEVNNGITFL